VHRSDEHIGGGRQPGKVGTRERESAASTSGHTSAAPVATMSVDDDSIGFAAQCPVRASRDTGGAGRSSLTALRSPDGDRTALDDKAAQQRPPRDSTLGQARPPSLERAGIASCYEG